VRDRGQVPLLPVLVLLMLVAASVLPGASAAQEGTDWASRIAEMDGALARGDVPAARAAWHEAYVVAHVTHPWPGMVAAGDAALRLGQATGAEDLYQPRARRAYLTALLRARRQGSLDGVLSAGGAFGRLGDGQMVREALAVANDLARRSGDEVARRRVQVFRSQWVAYPRS
jgi:hypothetical protein